MLICEEKGKDLFRINKAGEWHLNIYKGCLFKCPFCYWQADPDWVDHLYVYTDVAERLAKEIEKIPSGSVIWVNYGPLEQEWHLTRKCIEILLKHNMSLMVSSDYKDVLDDVDLFVQPGADVKIIMEFSKFDLMDEFNKTGTNEYFEIANSLKKNGVDVCVTVSPVLPGITDVETISQNLPSIPVHISLLDVRPGTLWGINTLDYVKTHYPSLYSQYQLISETGRDPYYESLVEKYKDDKGFIKTYLPFYDHRPSDGEIIKR